MKKLYCYLESGSGGYDVYEYTPSGRFIFYGNYKNKSEANEIIHKLSI